MVNLEKKDLIFEGGRRLIYLNPMDNSQLIKISKIEEFTKKRERFNIFKKLRSDKLLSENYEDYQAYKLYNKKPKEIFSFIPKEYGFIETNLGYGFVTEFIKNFDNTKSLSLKDYISMHGYNENVKEAIDSLHSNLLKYNLITRELQDFNISVKILSEKNDITLYIIDGFGNQEFFPISNYIPLLSRRKINKHFNNFLKKFSFS